MVTLRDIVQNLKEGIDAIIDEISFIFRAGWKVHSEKTLFDQREGYALFACGE